MSDRVAVILAAGKSTRMKSARSKVLHELFGRPMIEYVLDAARGAGVTRCLVVIGHEGVAVQEALAHHKDVEFVWQENPQGTGHAVMVCEDQLKRHTGSLLVLAGDTPLLRSESLSKLLDTQTDASASAVIGTAITQENFGLGRIVRDDSDHFVKIVEQKDATPDEAAITEINTGCYAFAIESLLSAMHEIKPNNNQGELYLTDIPAVMRARDEPVVAVTAFDIQEAMGVNTRVQLAQVRDVLHQSGLQQLMQAGAGIVNPALVEIDPRATIGQDTLIHPFSIVRGPCQIGSNCTIGPHAILDHCDLAEGEIILPFEHRHTNSSLTSND